MNEQAHKELLGFRKAVVFNLDAAKRRVEKIKFEGKPDYYLWMEEATIAGHKTCIMAIDARLKTPDSQESEAVAIVCNCDQCKGIRDD